MRISFFSGHSSMRLHAKTKVKDLLEKLEDIKISLNLGDMVVQIIKSQNPETLGKNIIRTTLL